MTSNTLTTVVEKIDPTAIIKVDGPLNDFQAKEMEFSNESVVIDFSSPQGFVNALQFCIKNRHQYLELLLQILQLHIYFFIYFTFEFKAMCSYKFLNLTTRNCLFCSLFTIHLFKLFSIF